MYYFKYVYRAEPLDFWYGILTVNEYIETMLLHPDAKKKERFDRFCDDTNIGWLTKAVAEIESFMLSEGEDLRTEIGIMPYIEGFESSLVFIAKADNNGTTYYFSNVELTFGKTSMERIR